MMLPLWYCSLKVIQPSQGLRNERLPGSGAHAHGEADAAAADRDHGRADRCGLYGLTEDVRIVEVG